MAVAKKATAKAAAPPKKATAKKAVPPKKAAAKKSAGARTSRLPEKIRPLDEGLTSYVRMMIYGDPGVGKTPLAATAPNALILEADRGEESAVFNGSTAKKWVLEDYNDSTEAYNYLRAGGTKDFDWLILDGITMFQERGLDHIMADLVAAKPHRFEYAPDKGEFGQNMNRIAKFIRDLKDLPINLILTAHAMVSERELADGSTITSMMPAVQGRLMPQKICGYVGIVAHLQTVQSKKDADKDYPVLSTRRIDGWYGKDRYSAIGRMPNPTIPKVLAAIEKRRNAADTPTKEK